MHPQNPSRRQKVSKSSHHNKSSAKHMLESLLHLHGHSRVHLSAPKPQVESHNGSARLVAPVFVCLLTVALQLSQPSHVEAVDCFVCMSRNGSNPACEDPFHNLNSTRVTTPQLPEKKPPVSYHTPCYASRKHRNGLFPASACLKMSGTFENGETIVVRHCGLDSGTLTQDTEIVRMSHCGSFQLDGDYLKGCVMACSEDGCNSAPQMRHWPGWFATWTPCLLWLASIYLLAWRQADSAPLKVVGRLRH